MPGPRRLKLPPERKALLRDIRFKIARKILPRVKAACASRSLKQFIQYYQRHDGEVVIAVPHYWAAYYNDGRDEIVAANSGRRWLIYFPDAIKDDPRLRGNYLLRYSEFRSITPEEFDFFVKLQGGIHGPYMYAVKSVGPAAGKHFFERGFTDYLASGGAAYITNLFRSELEKMRLFEVETDEAKVGLKSSVRLRSS